MCLKKMISIRRTCQEIIAIHLFSVSGKEILKDGGHLAETRVTTVTRDYHFLICQ